MSPQVIVALFGMWYFKEKTNLLNLTSIAAGLAAGVLFVFAKSANKESGQTSRDNSKRDEEPDEEQALLDSRENTQGSQARSTSSA